MQYLLSELYTMPFALPQPDLNGVCNNLEAA